MRQDILTKNMWENKVAYFMVSSKQEDTKGQKAGSFQGMPSVPFSPARSPYSLVSTTLRNAITLWIFNWMNLLIKSPMAGSNGIPSNSTFQHYYIGIQVTHENLRGHLISRTSENEQTLHWYIDEKRYMRTCSQSLTTSQMKIKIKSKELKI